MNRISTATVARVRKARGDSECPLCYTMITIGNRIAYLVDLGAVAGWVHVGCCIDYQRSGFATFPARTS